MSHKEKRNKQDYLDFLSPLNIETCKSRLIEEGKLKIRFINAENGQVDFTARYSDYGLVLVTGKCRLKTWAESLSRLECQIKVEQRSLVWIGSVTLGLVIALMLIPFIFFSGIEGFADSWLKISFFPIAFILGIMLVVNYYNPIEDSSQRFVDLLKKTLAASD